MGVYKIVPHPSCLVGEPFGFPPRTYHTGRGGRGHRSSAYQREFRRWSSSPCCCEGSRTRHTSRARVPGVCRAQEALIALPAGFAPRKSARGPGVNQSKTPVPCWSGNPHRLRIRICIPRGDSSLQRDTAVPGHASEGGRRRRSPERVRRSRPSESRRGDRTQLAPPHFRNYRALRNYLLAGTRKSSAGNWFSALNSPEEDSSVH